MAYTLERKYVSEFIQKYKEHPCLWNTSHALYSNKLARNRALEVLLESYQKFDKTANIFKMKRKLENMRTTYRREHQKVIKSQLTGNGKLYEPSLWYYPDFLFLDEMDDAYFAETTVSGENTNDDGDDNDESVYSESALQSNKRPKPATVFLTESENDSSEVEPLQKSSSAKKVKKSSIYLAEEDNIYQEETYTLNNEPINEFAGTTSDPDLFGKSISAQLNNLRPKQRFIAEKLISDVIFFGRLDKLKTGTTLNLNSDCF